MRKGGKANAVRRCRTLQREDEEPAGVQSSLLSAGLITKGKKHVYLVVCPPRYPEYLP